MAEFFITLPSKGQRRGGDHLLQVGRAAELAGYTGAYAPFDPEGEESLVIAAGLLRQTRYLRLLAGFHPGIATPVYAAKVAASLQRFSGDRLDWRIDVDLDPAVARAHGDFTEGADRYARAEEFLTIAKGVWHQRDYTHEGRYYQVLSGGFAAPLSGRAFPRVHLSGTSPDALALSLRHADVHVFDHGDDLSLTAELPGLAYGLRLAVHARETEREAALDGFDGLAGSYESIARRLRDYIDQGVEVFYLEATPYLEETYRLGEHLLPLLAREDVHAG
ncbi:LLM class flavin-dependent oxidoreductase [Nonomuraea sp. NPDC004354]